MSDYPVTAQILEQIRGAFGASGYSEHVARNAADYLAMIQADAEQKLNTARQELQVAEARRTAVTALIKAATGELATQRTTDALTAQLANSDRTRVILATDIANVAGDQPCPAHAEGKPHDAHTWRFPQSSRAWRCGGYAEPETADKTPVAGNKKCDRDDPHPGHNWTATWRRPGGMYCWGIPS